MPYAAYVGGSKNNSRLGRKWLTLLVSYSLHCTPAPLYIAAQPTVRGRNGRAKEVSSTPLPLLLLFHLLQVRKAF